MGTLIRTADAAGIDLIVLEKGTADPYQDKVLRASQGSVFHIPIITRDLSEFIEGFNGNVYGTALEHAIPYNQVKHQESFALLLGNEGEGVNPDLLKNDSEFKHSYIWSSRKFKCCNCRKYIIVSFERLTL